MSAANNVPPPQRVWLTGYARAIGDFDWLAKPEIEGRFFRTEDVLSAYAKQLKPLEKRFQIFAALSFLGRRSY